jgi:hypothetical protein
MLGRATLIWFTILIVAIANGALREGLLKARLGDDAAHVISALLLSVAVFVVTRMTIRWIGPANHREAWSIGLSWLGLTVAFEFLAGHYLFGTPWPVLLNDYRLFEGRLWILVLASALLAPVVLSRRFGSPRAPAAATR